MAVRLSAVTALRDAARPLRTALGWWVQQEAVDEIVVVDFGSERPLSELGLLEVPKLVLVHAGAGEPWARGLALNVGIEAAQGETVLAFDCGDALHGLGEKLDAFRSGGGYATSYGRMTAGCELAMLRRADWQTLGGFHEYLLGAGFEDEDLFNRLEDAGVRHRFFEPDDVQRSGAPVTATDDGQLGLVLPDGMDRNRGFQIGRNKILAGLAPWTAAMTGLRPRRFGRTGERALHCELAARTALERRLQDCASFLAARFLHNASEEVAFPMLRDMIDERFVGYEERARRQRQIELALAARPGPKPGRRRTR